MTSFLQNISCDTLHGVGPKILERLHKLDLFNIQDLLFHLPVRYEDRTKISPIRSLRAGDRAVIVGVVAEVEVVRRSRPILYCTLRDASGSIEICFFNFAKQRLQSKFQFGVKLYCVGDVRFAGRSLTIAHPEYKILGPNEDPPLSKSLTPIYPATEGLSQSLLRKLVSQAIKIAEKNKKSLEYFPENILFDLKFPSLFDAFSFVHEPPAHLNSDEVLDHKHIMRKRLIFEELLAQQLSLLKLRMDTKKYYALPLNWDENFVTKFFSSLPFELTCAQLKVTKEIAEDLKKPKPMLRLLQGDVGCGKTVVGALAIANTVKNGRQAAIMVPTELLAEQHFKNISSWLSPFGINVVLLSNKVKGKKREAVLQMISDGEAQVIVGTHALFQGKVKFKDLVLVVIDEQHRFGVHQRSLLRDKGYKNNQYPHQLIMTATPIPRTLTMTIYADLDCSVIDELPKGRAPVKTLLISNERRKEVLQHIKGNCLNGKQVYWVCPLIEESEYLECQAAETLAFDLAKKLPELRIGLVHGRKSSEEKEDIMSQFAAHKIDLLVATTVIEVGVDVPNASLMIIENAERLGLVQLHQLRGRVGRGRIESFCVLMYQNPLSHQARLRLTLLRDSNDGFFLARKDLEMRGAGEVLGVRQTGLLDLKIADLIRDQYLVPEVQKTALILLDKHKNVVDNIINRWLSGKERYGDVV